MNDVIYRDYIYLSGGHLRAELIAVGRHMSPQPALCGRCSLYHPLGLFGAQCMLDSGLGPGNYYHVPI